MNFIEAFERGKEGKNVGLPTGLKKLDQAIGGVKKKKIYTIAAAPKGGKTTLADFSFVIEPVLFYMRYRQDHPDSMLRVNWIYFSFEIGRIEKEAKFVCYFMFRDYDISTYTYNGKLYKLRSQYIMGEEKDADGNRIPISPEHEEIIRAVYRNRIIPLFGEYDSTGKQVSLGPIRFISEPNNPTGLRNEMLHYAKANGEFVVEKYHTLNEMKQPVIKERIIGYKPHNPELFTIVVTDHMRKLRKERGFSLKDNIDKWVEYQVELRNICFFTFVDIIHLNRNMSNIDRIKFQKDTIYPTGADVKDTGNLSEDSDYVITMFNPAEETYKLDKHFGYILESYPGYRSIHLVESRDTEAPQHLAVQMYAGINLIKQI